MTHVHYATHSKTPVGSNRAVVWLTVTGTVDGNVSAFGGPWSYREETNVRLTLTDHVWTRGKHICRLSTLITFHTD